MGVRVIAIYRPKPGRAADLLALTEQHTPSLRALGLATETPSIVLRAPDGTLLEHFEWASQDAIREAHEHPDVHAMWGRYDECCEYGTLAELPNASAMFPEFEYVGTY